MCSARPKTAKITSFLPSCGLYTSKTVRKSYFQYPWVVIYSRNYFTAVPQASTPRHSSDFWAFFAIYPIFLTFLLKISTFSLERTTGTVARFFLALSRFEATFATILAVLRWTYGVLVLQPRKTLRKTKNRYFAKNLSFLRSKAFHWVTLH